MVSEVERAPTLVVADTVVSSPPRPLRPWLAALLSTLFAGLGHLYAGRPIRSVAYVALMLAVSVVGSYLAIFNITSFVVSIGLSLGATLWIAGDAAQLASGDARREYDWRPKWWLYIVFFILSLGLQVAIKPLKASAAYQVMGDGMSPMLVDGDYVIVDRSAYRSSVPAIGDVVVFQDPDQPTHVNIDRVVAVSGDTAEIVGETVLINDRPMTPLHDEELYQAGFDADFPEEIVPDGHVFVLGDELLSAKDSRHFGFIPTDWILGRVAYVYASSPNGSVAPDLSRIGMQVH